MADGCGRTGDRAVGMRPGFVAWSIVAFTAFVSLACGAATPSVSLGYNHGLALSSDGIVYAWGSDQFGKLGTGRSIYSTIPIPVSGISGVRSVAGGRRHSIALRQDGSVWAWGGNDYGQVGDGGFTDQPRPVPIAGLSAVVAICAGEYHSAALLSDGTVWTWGNNLSGQLGHGAQIFGIAVPGQVPNLAGVTAIACGSAFTMALLRDGSVWVWGSNTNGALGTGALLGSVQPLPTRIPSLTSVTAIAVGQTIGAVVKQDGTVWEWGYVFSTRALRNAPVQSPGISGALSVAAAIFTVVAVGADHTRWWSWEAGTVPAPQNPVGNIAQLARGRWQTLILLSDGSVAS